MKRKSPDAKVPARARSSVSADAMRSLLRLALSMHAPMALNRDRLTAAMDAFGRVVSFDVWIVATVESTSQNTFRFAENILSGATDATVETAGTTAAKWASLLASNPPSIQPLFGKRGDARLPKHSLIRVWTDAQEQSLISIRSSSALASTEPEPRERKPPQLTWFSVHRLNPVGRSFTAGDRRLLAILHEQASWALNQ